MSEMFEAEVGRGLGVEASAGAPVGGGGGGGPERGRSPSGGEPPPPPAASMESATSGSGIDGGAGDPVEGTDPDGPSPVRLSGRYTGRSPRSLRPAAEPGPAITPEQRLLLLDTWQR